MALQIRVSSLLFFGPICEGKGSALEMGKEGLEPPTLRLSSVYSNQLSYVPKFPIERRMSEDLIYLMFTLI